MQIGITASIRFLIGYFFLRIFILIDSNEIVENGIERRVLPQAFINKCGLERKVYNRTNWGRITNNDDGGEVYCEWLIIPSPSSNPSRSKFFNLELVWLDLDCSDNQEAAEVFDILYIFEMETFSSSRKNLIISLNHGLDSFGSSSVSLFFRTSGTVLVRFKSQKRYVQQRFLLEFSWTQCPQRCNEHGICQRNHCQCDKDHFEELLYLFSDCIREITMTNFSKLIVYSFKQNLLYDFNAITKTRCFQNQNDSNVTRESLIDSSDTLPPPSKGFSLNFGDRKIILFGGQLSNGTFSNKLWLFDLILKKWSFIESTNIPGLMFHQSVIVESNWLYVVGGLTEDYSKSLYIYRINFSVRNARWDRIETSYQNRFFIAFQAIYSELLRSILIFGCCEADHLHRYESNGFYLFNIDSHRLLKLESRSNSSTDHKEFHRKKILFPSSLIIINQRYLIIHNGGMIESDCSSRAKLFVLDLICLQWNEPLNLVKLNRSSVDYFHFVSMIKADDKIIVLDHGVFWFSVIPDHILLGDVSTVLSNTTKPPCESDYLCDTMDFRSRCPISSSG
ncbi:multiple epidermal growth factor-like protein domains protein 8-like protein [Sarcoptes scabiei]|uniref:Multiple epidermal growth factor-like protein domains protein 8-like protein n=1 Tax=Sarcoptes scabiei TaxID=52283 RepID=A0A131ZWV1_SARSC|nr:multiple epidermal growth factor-like protein domains protein 8-like protein [Sarcoptes scabiei]